MSAGFSDVLKRSVVSGSITALLSLAVASLLSKKESGDADGAVNAVSHIAWGGRPEQYASRGGLNTLVGAALHHGASIFWAIGFETLFGRRARQQKSVAVLGGIATAATAYVVDYHVVSNRFKPGFEARLSGASMFLVYAALAAGLTASVWRWDQRDLPTIK
jgi:hypothetical protein